MIDQKKARFKADPRMLNFTRVFLRPKVYEVLEEASRSWVPAKGRNNAEVLLLHELGFLELTEDGSIATITPKGRELLLLLQLLMRLVYDGSSIKAEASSNKGVPKDG